MTSRYSKLSFWIVITILVWLGFGTIYWFAPKTFKVADIRDGIFLEKSKEVTSLVYEELFSPKDFECKFRNDNIYCKGEYPKKVCFDDGQCSDSKFHVVLATNDIDEKKISASIYLLEESTKRLFAKESLDIVWPELEQYLIKMSGFYINTPKTIRFSSLENKVVRETEKSSSFEKILVSKKLINVKGNYFLNLDFKDGFLDELEQILVPYSNKPNFNRALYFSGITLLSIGYGDIVPVSGLGRMLAILEGFIGLILMAIIAVVFYDGLRKGDF